MQWAFRWLRHVKPLPVLRLGTRATLTRIPFVFQRPYSSVETKEKAVISTQSKERKEEVRTASKARDQQSQSSDSSQAQSQAQSHAQAESQPQRQSEAKVEPEKNSHPAQVPPANSDYRESYEFVIKVLAPPGTDAQGNHRSPVVPALDQQAIYQLLQHVKEGVLPSQFATLDWPGATEFWIDLAKKALEHDQLVPDVFSFAQWWAREKGVQWPNLYETFLMFFIGHGQLNDAKRWHMKMTNSHMFHPDRETFANILNTFAGDRDPNMQNLLNSMYSLTSHRDMHDLVVPVLYRRGMSQLAMKWHSNFHKRKDYSRDGSASRAWLVFMKAYAPGVYKQTVPDHLKDKTGDGEGDLAKQALELGTEDSEESELKDDASVPFERALEMDASKGYHSPELTSDHPHYHTFGNHAVRDTTNLRFGHIFNITEKEYNDRLGARWLASTWISLDTSFSVIHGLGITEIGPLSLQSVAIREKTWGNFASRLNQLNSLGIAVQEGNYTTLLKKYTRTKNQKHLSMLLESDMHPDSFEDLDLLDRLKRAKLADGNDEGAQFWAESRDIVSEKRANHLIESLYDANNEKALDVLDDLAVSNLTLSPESLNRITHQMMNNIPFTRNLMPPKEFFQFQIDIYLRLLGMGTPLPSLAWSHLFFSLGRHHRLFELENLALVLTQHVLGAQQSGPGFMSLHPSDVPSTMQAAEDLGRGRFRIPNDLQPRHEWHFLNRVFNSRLQSSILRWGIQQTLTQNTEPTKFDFSSVYSSGGRPREFYVARGIRLLRILKDKGLDVIPDVAISKRVILRLAELYGPEIRQKAQHRAAREKNTLNMDEFVRLCNEAWGTNLMPLGDKLVDLVWEAVGKAEKGHGKYIERKKTEANLAQAQETAGVIRKVTGRQVRVRTIDSLHE
ncbi:hypothetical protein MKZ38_006783 [Zalerion maritima]|uniref:Uncharacterized protein n=1 Tax=Zalerion maritima TaxID=339359 RepID=A0AAD5RN97_9PEZI|nr:hypothetical protein MKZ38_006783 [Zalerion maritima]